MALLAGTCLVQAVELVDAIAVAVLIAAILVQVSWGDLGDRDAELLALVGYVCVDTVFLVLSHVVVKFEDAFLVVIEQWLSLLFPWYKPVSQRHITNRYLVSPSVHRLVVPERPAPLRRKFSGVHTVRHCHVFILVGPLSEHAVALGEGTLIRHSVGVDELMVGQCVHGVEGGAAFGAEKRRSLVHHGKLDWRCVCD